ncbi:MAG TPA: DUF4270 family protein [Bacteroidales bacterium]|nr:DUF4270 family protein [Bacteroidales bacterium]
MTRFYNRKNANNHNAATAWLSKNILPLLIALPAMLSSCSDNPSKIGIGLLPDSDFMAMYSTDTVGVRAYTMYDDSAITTNNPTMVAGRITDEYFGNTNCDFVTQLRIIAAWPQKTYTVDSVFFYFNASSVSGDTAAVHYLRLYETGTRLLDSTDYYSTQEPDTIKFLGEYLLPPLKADTSYWVPLDTWVGEYLFRNTSMFNPPTDFYKEFFRGLYVGIRSETNPVLVTMTTADNPLMLTVSYHDTADVSYTYSFLSTDRAVNYNRFIHDHAAAAPDKRIQHINDLVTDTAVYFQTYDGVYPRFDLPSLESFRNIPRLAVNKARLYIPVHLDVGTYVEANLPTQIYLRYRNSEGKLIALPDLVHDISFMDGTYYSADDNYVFNIASFVQQYLNGEIEEPSVEMYYPSSVDKNVIFQVNGNSPTVKFEFAYTIY